MSGLEPSRDAVKVKGVLECIKGVEGESLPLQSVPRAQADQQAHVALSPGYAAVLLSCTALIRLAFDACEMVRSVGTHCTCNQTSRNDVQRSMMWFRQMAHLKWAAGQGSDLVPTG